MSLLVMFFAGAVGGAITTATIISLLREPEDLADGSRSNTSKNQER